MKMTGSFLLILSAFQFPGLLAVGDQQILPPIEGVTRCMWSTGGSLYSYADFLVSWDDRNSGAYGWVAPIADSHRPSPPPQHSSSGIIDDAGAAFRVLDDWRYGYRSHRLPLFAPHLEVGFSTILDGKVDVALFGDDDDADHDEMRLRTEEPWRTVRLPLGDDSSAPIPAWGRPRRSQRWYARKFVGSRVSTHASASTTCCVQHMRSTEQPTTSAYRWVRWNEHYDQGFVLTEYCVDVDGTSRGQRESEAGGLPDWYANMTRVEMSAAIKQDCFENQDIIDFRSLDFVRTHAATNETAWQYWAQQNAQSVLRVSGRNASRHGRSPFLVSPWTEAYPEGYVKPAEVEDGREILLYS